jgi:hypothetical protein
MAERDHPLWSNWHITVNTNQHERTDAERAANARVLADAVDDATTMQNLLFNWLMYYSPARAKERLTEEQQGAVVRIRNRVSLEEGPNAANRSVHCHWLIEVMHYTRIQVDMHALRDVLVDLTGFNGLNIRIRFVKGDGEDREYLLRYLQKDGVPARAARDEDNRRLGDSELVAEDEVNL